MYSDLDFNPFSCHEQHCWWLMKILGHDLMYCLDVIVMPCIGRIGKLPSIGSVMLPPPMLSTGAASPSCTLSHWTWPCLGNLSHLGLRKSPPVRGSKCTQWTTSQSWGSYPIHYHLNFLPLFMSVLEIDLPGKNSYLMCILVEIRWKHIIAIIRAWIPNYYEHLNN